MEQIILKLKHFLKLNGWESYKNLKSELLALNTKDLIIHILNDDTMRDSNVTALLLAIPELWKDFNLNDWKYIIQNVNRPSNYRLLMDNKPCFEDIRFLYNWIGIDSVKLYKNDLNISEENRRILDRIFPAFLVDSTRNGEFYRENFQDGTFGDIRYFKEMKNRLISQGATPSAVSNL